MNSRPYTGRSPSGIRKKIYRARRLLLLAALLLAVLVGGGFFLFAPPGDQAPAEDPAEHVEAPEPIIQPEPPVVEPEEPVLPTEEQDPVPEEPVLPPEEPDPYDFTQPVPLSDEVDRSYFDDAVFIGDSRTDGLMIYTGLSNATFYTYKGLTVSGVFTDEVIQLDGKDVTAMEALEKTDFAKVYIMFGVNEAGWKSGKTFADKYGEIVDAVRALNPDAVIYVQSILPVSREVSETHPYVTNEKLSTFNDLLREMAAEKEAYFVDTAAAVADEEGFLPDDAAVDGIHPNKAYCGKWLSYLQTHTIS